MKKRIKNITLLLWLLIVAANAQDASASAGANLNQARNGTDTIPVNPMQWVNGNIGPGTGHYKESMSAPFQCIMTGLTAGVQVTIVIGYDIRNSSKNAYDYLTHYNRILPHIFGFHSTPETINPLTGTGLAAGTAYTTYPIPAPSSAGSTVTGMPTASFNAVPDTERVMTLYNGTIDTVYYVVQGSLTASQSETQMAVTFTPSGATAVLLWGGHLGSRFDWGPSITAPNSAGGISGSPFHMRLVSWTLNNLGNTDRSLSGAAVGLPYNGALPVELTNFNVNVLGEANLVEWTTATEINNYNFTLERSSSLTDFHPLTTVEGAGNSNITINYAWSDDAPLGGISYYRIVQTDFDGTQKIFGPVCVYRNDPSVTLSVLSTYPNPFTDDFTLTYFSAHRSATTIEILDATGKQVWLEKLNPVSGVNYYHFKNQSLPQGIYFVTLSQAENNKVTVRTIRK